MARFNNLGIIKNEPLFDEERLGHFTQTIEAMKAAKSWYKDDIVHLFHEMIPNFGHKETGKYLDGKR